jgi:hypothetical protein
LLQLSEDKLKLENHILRPMILNSENKQIFPVASGRFLSESARSWLEVTEKTRRHSEPKHCVQVSSIFGFFLPESARTPLPGIIMFPVSGAYYHRLVIGRW